MKKISIIFLQVVVVFIGISTLTFMLWEPHFEGRNAQATVFEIYFKDPFLAYAYISSISFFVILYQAFQALVFVKQNRAFSQDTLKALRTIKYCGVTLASSIVAGVAYIVITMHGKDDIAGGVAMGLFLIIIALVIAAVAAMFERRMRKEISWQS